MYKSKTLYILWALIFTVIGLSPTTAAADDDVYFDDFNIGSAADVPMAVARIRSSLEDQGFTIVATINHAANAAGVGLELRPTQLILFTKPNFDAGLIRRSPTVGIDVPQKFLVWEDDTGAIRFSYNDIGYLVDRHGIPLRDRFLRKNDRVLEQFGSLPNGLITIDSDQSVADTVETLIEVLENAGFFIPLVIDQRAAGSHPYSKRDRPMQLIVFGNPRVGTQLMQVNQAIGIDLPQKFLVWEDRADQVHITYNDPNFLASRHAIAGLDTLLGNIANALRNFAEAGAGSPE